MDQNDILEFLAYNKNEIISDLAPDVNSFLEKKQYFYGPYRQAFNIALKNFILDLLKDKLISIFNLNYEEISVIINKETKGIDYFLNEEEYKNVNKN